MRDVFEKTQMPIMHGKRTGEEKYWSQGAPYPGTVVFKPRVFGDDQFHLLF